MNEDRLPGTLRGAAPVEWVLRREAFFERAFGPMRQPGVYHFEDDRNPHIDVYTLSRTKDRPFETLITGGMADRPQPGVKAGGELQHADVFRSHGVVGNRDAPAKVAARHRMRRSRIDRRTCDRALDVARACDPGNQARLVAQRRLHRGVVEIEPARPRRTRQARVDRDQLEVDAPAETHERVVRSHRGVLPAGTRRDTGEVRDIFDRLREGCAGDDEVVELRGRRSTQHERSEASKSSSTRAPFGSKKNSCHVPEPTCCRHA